MSFQLKVGEMVRITCLVQTIGCEYSYLYVYPCPQTSKGDLARYRATYGEIFKPNRRYSIWETFKLLNELRKLAMIYGDNVYQDSQYLPLGRPTTLAQ